MKQTIKTFKTQMSALPYLKESSHYYGRQDAIIVLSNKEQSQWAKCFTQFCWYAENILKTFPQAEISFDSENLYFTYPSGEARLYTEKYHTDVLIPAIEEICTKYGKVLTNKNPYQLPQTA